MRTSFLAASLLLVAVSSAHAWEDKTFQSSGASKKGPDPICAAANAQATQYVSTVQELAKGKPERERPSVTKTKCSCAATGKAPKNGGEIWECSVAVGFTVKSAK